MDTAAFKAAVTELRSSTYWGSRTKLAKGYAAAYPSEAAVLSAFMDALASGSSPTPPNLGSSPTKFGHGLMTMLAATEQIASPVGGALPTGWLDIHKDLGCPVDPTSQTDWSAGLQSHLTGADKIPLGYSIRLSPLSYSGYRWNVDASDRTDVGFGGHETGQVGNYRDAAAEMVGSWVRPARDQMPCFDYAAAVTAQSGPTIRWIKSYHGEFTTQTGSLLRVKNVNAGVLEHIGSMYGKVCIDLAPGASTSDCAWWRVVDVRAFDCAWGAFYFDGNLGWTVDGATVVRASPGQRGFRMTGYAQNNRVSDYRCDGQWTDTTIGGSGGLIDGGAHNNSVSISKVESAIPGIELQSPHPDLQSPTRGNVIGGPGVVGERYGLGPAILVGPYVDQTLIEKNLGYVNGPADDARLIQIDPLATGTDWPGLGKLIRGFRLE